MLHSLLHGLVRSAEISLHNSPLVHENKGGAMLGAFGGMVAGVALATTPVGWGIGVIIGMGGGALVEKGVKGLTGSKSK
jgi:Na+-translocating ferredoxin:NAD+ oxidoreductase RnfD subunit